MAEPTLAALAELGVFLVDRRRGSAYPHRLWRKWGIDARALFGERRLEIVHTMDRDRVRAEFDALEGGERDSSQGEYRITTAEGDRWVLSRLEVVSREPEGGIRVIVGADFDVTERKRAEINLRLSRAEAEFRAQEAETLRIAGAVIASTLELDEVVHRVLQQAQLVIPFDQASVQTLTDGELIVVGSSSSAEIGTRRLLSEAPLERSVIEGGQAVHERGSFAVPLHDGAEAIGVMTFHGHEESPLSGDHEKMASALADHVSIAVRNARLYAETRHLAVTDVLTGSATRRWFLPHADAQVEQARRFAEPISVLMIDIDHFKQINDTRGHAAGDSVLRELGERLRTTLRGLDAVCRYGGEEFVVLLPRTGAQTAAQIAERIRKTVRAISRPEGDPPVTVSIGAATTDTDDGASYEINELIRRADSALYAAKAAGRDRVHAAPGPG